MITNFSMESSTSKLTFGHGKEKILLLIVAIVGTLAIGFIIATIILGVKYSNKEINDTIPAKVENATNKNASEICNTEECVTAAGDIIKRMDKSVNPCHDFYQFTCGNWIKNNPIPEGTTVWDGVNMLPTELYRKIRGILETKISENEPVPVKYAKQFYKSCLDQNVTDQYRLYELIETTLKVGDLFRNVELKLGELLRRTGGQFIIKLNVELDEMNTSNHIIYLDRPTLGLDSSILTVSENPNRRFYIELIAAVWPLVYADPDKTTDFILLAENIVEFETKLARTIDGNQTDGYHAMTLTELKSLTINGTTINWEVYITEVFKDVIQIHNVDLGYLPNLTVVVRDIKYFKEFGFVVSSAHNDDPDILANYLRWRIILTYVNEVSSTLREVFFAYLRKVLGAVSPEPRWEICTARANQAFGMAISYHYVKEVFGKNFSSQMTEIMGNIRASVMDIIDTLEWLGNSVIRFKIKERLQNMKTFIGFPEWLVKNRTALDVYYQGLEFNESAPYFDNYLQIAKWKNMDSLKNLKKSQDNDKWLADPTYVGAFYSPTHNSITIPAGYLQPPFYFTGRPIQALNYGSIGSIIGHEITHGLDAAIADIVSHQKEPPSTNGSLLIEWWDKMGTLIKYSIGTNCFIKQYTQYVASDDKNLTINGNTTVGENVADNAGCHQSFKAYRSYVKKYGPEPKLPGLEYSPQQLFFVAFSQTFCGSYTPHGLESQILNDVHTPNHFRVKGVLQNSVEFAEAWNCPRPNLTNVCRLW